MGPQRVLYLTVALVLALGSLTQVVQAQIDEFHALLMPEVTNADVDDQVVITFEVDTTATHFNGYEIDVEWDPSIASLVSVQEGELMENACPDRWFDYPTTDSTVTVAHVLLCEGVFLDGPGELCVFTFAALDSGSTPLAITTDPNRAFFDAGLYIWPGHPNYPRQVFLHDALLCVGECVDDVNYEPESMLDRSLRMQILPNPIHEDGWIRCQLAAPAQALTIEILDVSGRLLRSWGVETGMETTFQLRWDGTDGDGRPLSKGTYFYRARSAGHLSGGKFQVLR